MLFGRQKADKISGKLGPLSKIAWDDEIVKWIADSERLHVRITHISKTVSLGKMRVDDDRHKDKFEWTWEVHGVMTYPKFVEVNITFAGHHHIEFGGFSYNRRDYDDFSLPILELWLSDQNEQKAQLIYDAFRDAIISGQKYMDIRFWKKKGDGWMTKLDTEHGFSYESQHEILGMVIWPTLCSERVPKWALPSDQVDFSFDDLPASRADLDRRLC